MVQLIGHDSHLNSIAPYTVDLVISAGELNQYDQFNQFYRVYSGKVLWSLEYNINAIYVEDT